jgi:hypothetical protein
VGEARGTKLAWKWGATWVTPREAPRGFSNMASAAGAPRPTPIVGRQHARHHLGLLGVGCFWTATPKAGLRAFGAARGML